MPPPTTTARSLAARGPAVVVAVSYRLGPFGFLQLGTAEEPEPSPAMTDLLAALDWVQPGDRRASAGDPDRLTLVGQSAGASLVCALLATEAGRGPAPPSPSPSAGRCSSPPRPWTSPPGCSPSWACTAPTVAGLRAVPAEAVADAAAAVARTSRRQRLGGVVFGPVLDGRRVPPSRSTSLASGALRDTALWFGSCRDEMTMFLQAAPDDAAAVARARVGGPTRSTGCSPSTGRPPRPGEDPLQALLTDEMWVRPAWELAEAQAAAGGRAWLSRFDHAPALPPYDVARADPRRGQRLPVGAPRPGSSSGRCWAGRADR